MTDRRAVFLDRDGVINVKLPEGEYVTAPEEFIPLPGAMQAIARMNAAGFLVFVVTNQRGVARGRLTLEQLDEIHEYMSELLSSAGAHVDGVYVCPHEAGACDCRKPAPGLLLRAKAEHPDVDMARSVMIGDAASDMKAGLSAGCGARIYVGPGGMPEEATARAKGLGDAWGIYGEGDKDAGPL